MVGSLRYRVEADKSGSLPQSRLMPDFENDPWFGIFARGTSSLCASADRLPSALQAAERHSLEEAEQRAG